MIIAFIGARSSWWHTKNSSSENFRGLWTALHSAGVMEEAMCWLGWQTCCSKYWWYLCEHEQWNRFYIHAEKSHPSQERVCHWLQ